MDKRKVITDNEGCKYWYLNGRLHRSAGPAVEYLKGPKVWWLNGFWISKEEHKGWMRTQQGEGL